MTKYIFLSLLGALFHFEVSEQQNSELVLIKGGTFSMGQIDAEADERPVHQVTIDDFYMGKYEVTVAEYRKFCEATGHSMPKEPAFGWKENHPVLNTSWNDAMAYIDWLNKSLDDDFRLPTEAEFEYVIRGGAKPGAYPWGKGNPKNENIADEAFKGSKNARTTWTDYVDGYRFTSPVGAMGTNALGVCDINGNVWEWCSDWYGDYSEEAVKNPQGPAEGKWKVGRGASFNADPWHCRSAGRNWVEPTFTGPGFRLAKSKL